MEVECGANVPRWLSSNPSIRSKRGELCTIKNELKIRFWNSNSKPLYLFPSEGFPFLCCLRFKNARFVHTTERNDNKSQIRNPSEKLYRSLYLREKITAIKVTEIVFKKFSKMFVYDCYVRIPKQGLLFFDCIFLIFCVFPPNFIG
jgi:hypothetical protein